MLKIAIDCRMIGSSGIGSYISELIPYFLEKNECLLIGTHEQCMDFVRLENVEFCFCDIKPFSYKEMFDFSKDVLEKINKYDFYFTPYCNIPNGIQIPIFSTIHDVVFLDIPELTSFIGRLGRKIIYQRAINKSKEIFTVSEFSKNRILKNLRCKKNITITYNSAPSYLKKEAEDEYETKKTDSILFVGNIKKHKGLKTLLDAFEIATKQGFSKKLIIVGNAENFRTGDEETVSRLSKLKESFKEKITFTGRISNAQLKRYYKEADFIVQPSFYEGFGIPPLEAMTVGTPAIISDIEVFKEIYKDFPVIFFKTGDSNDLADKMLNFDKKENHSKSDTNFIDIDKINEEYSYKKSAEIIMNVIKNHNKK